MNFYLGCAVWSYKGWVGNFYPTGSRSADFLSLYSQRFTTVEGNTTFYAVPQPHTIARWAEQTPPGFKLLRCEIQNHGRDHNRHHFTQAQSRPIEEGFVSHHEQRLLLIVSRRDLISMAEIYEGNLRHRFQPLFVT